MRSTTRHYWRCIIAVLFVLAGANHFRNPGPYLSMMPSYLPWPEGLVWVSGLAEMAGGLGVLFARVRVLAAWGLIALMVAVFPANLNVALHGWPGVSLPEWSLWLRLPLQIVFIWWVYRICIRKNAASDSPS
ncbi:MAG: DoxX family membrane protein [Akkermansiaceae bacterium]|nr:DoxX family membrane protein [Verrucomicrobiales bacterium]